MKKLFAILVSLVLICGMSAAFAFSWAEVETDACTEYTLTAEKYEKVDGDIGAFYKKSPAATAKIGDVVYFSVSAADTSGMEVVADVEYHNIGDVEEVDGLYVGKVIGSKPYVKISITEKTPIDELFYKNENLIVESNEVMIGNLVFLRDDNGVVRDVYHYGNYAEMLDDLKELDIDINDIYDGNIKMTDDILICNFGKVCVTEAKAAWYVTVEEEVLSIPKTGDAVSIITPILAMSSVAYVTFRKR